MSTPQPDDSDDAAPSTRPTAKLPPRLAIAPAPRWWPVPPLATTPIAATDVWPAQLATEVLRELSVTMPYPRADLVGAGLATNVIYESHGWCLRTSISRRFRDHAAAVEALAALAHTRASLGAFALEPTVLAIARDDGDHWLWTIAPWRKTLRQWMAEAAGEEDSATLGVALATYATAVVDALVLALRAGVALDLHPSNFALAGSAIGYLADHVTHGQSTVPAAATAILQRAEEHARYPDALDRYRGALLAELRRLTPAELDAVGFATSLCAASPRALAARALRAELAVAFVR